MRRSGIIAILGVLLTAAAFADVVTIPLNYVYSGTTPTGVFLTATFTDVAGGVQLVMSTSGVGTEQFVSDWAFNLDPTFSTPLTFTQVSGTPGTVTTGTDFYQADGDGSYDIHFSFPTGGSSRFWGGSTSEYLIQASGLTAADFNYLSTPAPGGSDKGPYFSAAHLQGGGVVAWVGADHVPEPTSYPVYGAAMAVLCMGILQRIRSRAR